MFGFHDKCKTVDLSEQRKQAMGVNSISELGSETRFRRCHFANHGGSNPSPKGSIGSTPWARVLRKVLNHNFGNTDTAR